jgi:hypothetical protein
MNNPSTLPLAAFPQESLRALQNAVGEHFQWRMQTGGTLDEPRFVIEKRVRYDLIRGLPMFAVYRAVGHLEKAKTGETLLHFAVSGQPGVPLLHAALFVGVLSLMTFALAALVSSPGMAGNPLGPLLVAALALLTVAYGVLAWRSYHRHLRELTAFMEAFARRAGTSA